MSRVTSLTQLDDKELNTWIKRIALILVVGAVAFTAFYLFDRWRPATTAIVDQRTAAYEEAVRKNPNDIAARGSLADLYYANGKYEQAIEQYAAIIATGKDEELARMGRARSYMALERWNDAKPDFAWVVDLASKGEMANVDPTLEEAHYNLGIIAMKAGDGQGAVAELSAALKIKRSDADALYQIGRAYTMTGQYDLAETALRKSVAFVPIGWADPYTALADTYKQAGKNDLSQWAAAMADVANGKTDSAETTLKNLVPSKEAGIDAALGLGILYETRAQPAEAARWYAAVLAVDAQNDEALLGAGRVGAPASNGPALPVPGGSN